MRWWSSPDRPGLPYTRLRRPPRRSPRASRLRKIRNFPAQSSTCWPWKRPRYRIRFLRRPGSRCCWRSSLPRIPSPEAARCSHSSEVRRPPPPPAGRCPDRSPSSPPRNQNPMCNTVRSRPHSPVPRRFLPQMQPGCCQTWQAPSTARRGPRSE